MKHLKLSLLIATAIISLTSYAQNVIIYKNGEIIDDICSYEIDSLAYIESPVPEGEYLYYIGPYSERPQTETALKGSPNTKKMQNTRLTHFYLPASTNTSICFIYPSDWGRAKLIDPFTQATYGNDKPEIEGLPGYYVMQLSLDQADSIAGSYRRIKWTK